MFRQRIRLRVTCWVVLVLLLFSITACANPQVSSSQPSSTAANGTTTGTTKTEPVVIKDHLGREIRIDQKIRTIVSGYYITSSLVIALGLEDALIGVEAKAETRPIYALAAPRVLALPSIGTAKDFDLEACISLKPDLVILPVKLKDSVAALEKVGIRVIAVNPESMELLKETARMIGQATGTLARAERLIAWYDQKLAMLAGLQSAGQSRKSVYLAGNSSMLSTATAKMYQNTLIDKAGGSNVASGIEDTYWATISYEQLIAYNPDILVIVAFATYSKDDVVKDTRLSGLNAVKSSQVYKMPDRFEAWDSPVPSGILGILWLASILNPEKYPFEQFKADATAFYSEFYDCRINPDDINK